MNFRTIFRNFKEGLKDPDVESNYGVFILGAGATACLYEFGQPEIGEYAIAAASVLFTGNLIKQYLSGKAISKNIEI